MEICQKDVIEIEGEIMLEDIYFKQIEIEMKSK